MGPGLEELFLGSFRFAIDQMIYQEENESALVPSYQQKLLFWVGERMGMCHTFVCRILEFLRILRGRIGNQTEAAGHE